MSGLAITAAAASPDWVARGIALGSLALSAGSMLLTRRLWRREGAELAFDLFIEAFRIPNTNVIHRMRVRIEVTNVGRMAATLRKIELRSPWPPFLRQVETNEGPLQVLQPTAFVDSKVVVLTAPEEAVRDALAPRYPDDIYASEIVRTLRVPDQNRVSVQVQRGDNVWFSRPRETTIEFRDEPWPAPSQ